MLIALPAFRDRVAPRLDSACEVLVLEPVNKGLPREVERLVWSEESLAARIRSLTQRGVGLLVCGALEPVAEESFRRHGIEVVSWVRASIEAVLEALAADNLESVQHRPASPA